MAALGERIEVQLGDLSDSAAAVRAAAKGVLDCGSRIRALSGTGGATGSSSCAAFFESMVSLWSDQLTFSAEEADSIAEATEGARTGYQSNESATGGMFRAGGPA